MLFIYKIYIEHICHIYDCQGEVMKKQQNAKKKAPDEGHIKKLIVLPVKLVKELEDLAASNYTNVSVVVRMLICEGLDARKREKESAL